jgi:peptidase E
MILRARSLSSILRTAAHIEPDASEQSSPVTVKPGTSGGTVMATPYCLGMATDAPTILATSGGYRDHDRLRFQFADLLHYAVDLSGTSGVVPRVCNVGTASGDDPRFQMDMSEAGRVAGFNLTHLSLFSMPNLDDIEGHLMAQDVVWVNGGSVANLLAVWRVHGLDEILRRVWQAGVVLGGVSAGSICWFEGGTTDSFGPELRAVTNGLGFLPYANGVHYDSEDRRRPLVHQLVADGTLGTTHCTDDGVGMLYRGTEFVEAVTEQAGKGAYVVRREGDSAVEERLETRLLGGRSAQASDHAAKSVTWQR